MGINPEIIKRLIQENKGLILDIAAGAGITGLAIEDINGEILLKTGTLPPVPAIYPVKIEKETICFIKESKDTPSMASLISNIFWSEKEKTTLAEKMSEALKGSIMAMAESVEIKDYHTGDHCKRVAGYAVVMGEELGIDKSLMKRLKASAFLHDIGKIGIKDEILLKPGKLTPEEYEIIKEHSMLGVRILKHIKKFEHLIPGVKEHHERWDGKGYPDGLKGLEINIIARIISVADAFDAMTAPRSYKDHPENYDYAFNEIRIYSGSQFAPECSAAFLKVFSHNISRIREIKKKGMKITFD